MSLRNVANIDKNFVTETTVKRKGLTYHSVEELDAYGVKKSTEFTAE